MADIRRSSTDLLTNLFQDGQPAGSITPQDMRDLILSTMNPAHGGYYIDKTATAPTTLTLASTYYKIEGTTIADSISYEISMPSNNRARYDGLLTQHFEVQGSICFLCDTNNQEIHFKIAKNGVVIDSSETKAKVGTAGDVAAVPIFAHIQLAQTDYIEIHAENITSAGTTVTVQRMNIFLKSIPE